MSVNGKRMVYLVALLAIAVVGYFAWKYTARSAYETAAYRVLESDGSFELREYPPLMMATTTARGTAKRSTGRMIWLSATPEVIQMTISESR